MPTTIQGSRGKSPGRGLDQEPQVRELLTAGETVYVFLNRVYFQASLEPDGRVRYFPLERKPVGAV